MTTNSPNPVDGDVQTLIEHIKKWKEGSTRFDSVVEFNKRQRQIYEIALASLTAEPFEYLTWHQGCRAPDDCEIYSAVTKKGDKSDDGSDAIPVYTTPPAQLLRPVELPPKSDVKMGGDAKTRALLTGMNMMLKSCTEALRQQGYEVKS